MSDCASDGRAPTIMARVRAAHAGGSASIDQRMIMLLMTHDEGGGRRRCLASLAAGDPGDIETRARRPGGWKECAWPESRGAAAAG